MFACPESGVLRDSRGLMKGVRVDRKHQLRSFVSEGQNTPATHLLVYCGNKNHMMLAITIFMNDCAFKI